MRTWCDINWAVGVTHVPRVRTIASSFEVHGWRPHHVEFFVMRGNLFPWGPSVFVPGGAFDAAGYSGFSGQAGLQISEC